MENIHGYKIIEKISEGGMGIVYKAVDEKNETVVAIKTLKYYVDVGSEAFIRFKKEAENLEKLNHKNILKFIDLLEKDKRLYIVTEYIDGYNLKDLINSNLTIDEKIGIILQIAEALDYVHLNGIIHRDIKPSNIMVKKDNTVKILDFGIANLMDFQDMITLSKNIEGSFAYMSPEQSGMLQRGVDTRSDLYSLGILFYQFITGKLPYDAKDVGELIHQHIAKIPEEPKNIVPELSPIINKIILKLIKKDPDERYQTAYGLAEDLKIYLQLNEEQKKTFYLELGKKDKTRKVNYSATLVDRKKELTHLLDNINNTLLKKGFSSLIIGKSGVGKSRLLQELQKYTSTKNAFYIYVASDERNKTYPFYSVITSIESVIKLFSKLGQSKKNEAISKIIKDLGEEGKILSKISPVLKNILGELPDNYVFNRKESEVFLDSLKNFFISVSEIRPLIIVFDDIHFWDEGSIQFFKHIQSSLRKNSIYILLSIREESLINMKDLIDFIRKEAGETNMSIIDIKNFAPDDVDSLILEIFGNVYLGLPEVSARLYEATSGNALLLIENIKVLVEEEIIKQKNEGWIVDLEKLSHFRFSSSILDNIISRISKISDSTKSILKIASILGKEFDFITLFQIIKEYSKINIKYSQFSQEKLLDNLEEATKNYLIEQKISESGKVIYSFSHDKVIESLISQIERKDYRDYHRIAGDVIKNNYHGNDKIYKLAYHYLEGDRRTEAYHYNKQAGDLASSSFSLKLAANFYMNSLNILRQFAKETKKAISTRIELALLIVDIYFQLGMYKENIALLEETMKLSEKNQFKEELAKCYYMLAKNYYFLGNQVAAMDFYYKVIPIAEELKLDKLLAIPYCAIGRANCYIAKFDDSIDYIQKGIAILPKDEEIEWIYSLGILAQSYAAVGLKREALNTISRLLEDFPPYDYELKNNENEIKEIEKEINEVLPENFKDFLSLNVIFDNIIDIKTSNIDKSQIEQFLKRIINTIENKASQKDIKTDVKILDNFSKFSGKKDRIANSVKNIVDKIKNKRIIKNEIHKLYIQFFKASVYSMIGNPKDALIESRKALDMSRELKNPTLEINSIFSIGRAYSNILNFQEAIKNISSAINLAKEHNTLIGIWMLMFALAENYYTVGNRESAKEAFEEGKKYVGISNPKIIEQWKLRLEALDELSLLSPDYDKCFNLIEKALEISKEVGKYYEYFYYYNLLTKSFILFSKGNRQEAEKIYDEVIAFYASRDLDIDINKAKYLKQRILGETEIPAVEDMEVTSTYTATLTKSQTQFSSQLQLKSLLEASEELAKSYQMEELLNKIMFLAMKTSGAQYGILFLYENLDDIKNSSIIPALKVDQDGKIIKDELLYPKLIVEKTITTSRAQLIENLEKENFDEELKTKIKSVITVPVKTSQKILGAIYLDNREVKGVFTKDKFELLKAFATQAAISIENARLYKQVQEKARIEQEMEIAKDIQTSILPFIKENQYYDIAGFMRTATEVGGDYYDIYLDNEPYFGVFGDVSGHGLKSGLVMMMAEVSFNTVMKDTDLKNKPIEYIYQVINKTLYENIQGRLSKKSKKGGYSHMYMTFRLFRFDKDGNFQMFGNDHAEPFICRKDTGEITPIPSSGFLIGIVEDAVMKGNPTEFKLKSGDILVLYSDGITEAKNESKGNNKKAREMFGEERLFDIVARNRDKSPSEIINSIIDAVDSWMVEQEDDITMLIIKKK
ncbi:MAG TPA: protein kinase [Spirochaetota bacterium]|nr:protein kinase [Spirochaetota bacterium]HOM39230.1 protein kinase [Spirochaetota bacterium]HPQ49933.1 protein kinase [Spirochaetota bacterium]